MHETGSVVYVTFVSFSFWHINAQRHLCALTILWCLASPALPFQLVSRNSRTWLVSHLSVYVYYSWLYIFVDRKFQYQSSNLTFNLTQDTVKPSASSDKPTWRQKKFLAFLQVSKAQRAAHHYKCWTKVLEELKWSFENLAWTKGSSSGILEHGMFFSRPVVSRPLQRTFHAVKAVKKNVHSRNTTDGRERR